MARIHCRPPSLPPCPSCWHVGSQQLRFPTSLPAFLGNTCAQASSSRSSMALMAEYIPQWDWGATASLLACLPTAECRGRREEIPWTAQHSPHLLHRTSSHLQRSWIRGFVKLEILQGASKKTSKQQENTIQFFALICTISGVHINSDRCFRCKQTITTRALEYIFLPAAAPTKWKTQHYCRTRTCH